MPKPKKRIGLQKDFSTIFDGVWIPPKPNRGKIKAEQAEQEQDNAVPTPTQNEQNPGIDTPTQKEQEQALGIPTSDRQNHADDTLSVNEPDQAVETSAADERYTVETPASDEQEQAFGLSAPDMQDPAPDIRTFNEPDQTLDMPIADDQQYRVETPAPVEQEPTDDTPTFEEHRRGIEKIKSSMKCPKGFACYNSNFENLCKVRNIGEGKIIECSPENQAPCVYRFTFMGKIFCKCPLRYYVARNLKM